VSNLLSLQLQKHRQQEVPQNEKPGMEKSLIHELFRKSACFIALRVIKELRNVSVLGRTFNYSPI
jgi:hypothetical protein